MKHPSPKAFIFTFLMCFACLASFFTAWTIARSTAEKIPAAALEEARIVCGNFSGVQHMQATKAGSESTEADGILQRWTITATCNSSHTITGVIAIK